MSAPDSAAVVMTGINLVLAASLLAAIVWRVGNKTASGSLIVGAGAGFALAVVLGLLGRSAGTPPDGLEKRIAGIESNIVELSQHIKDTQETIHKQNASVENRLSNVENNVHREVSEVNNFVKQIVVINNLKTESAPSPPSPPPPPPSPAKITIASMSVGPDPDRRHKGKRVVYLTLRTVGSSPAVVTSATSVFVPAAISVNNHRRIVHAPTTIRIARPTIFYVRATRLAGSRACADTPRYRTNISRTRIQARFAST